MGRSRNIVNWEKMSIAERRQFFKDEALKIDPDTANYTWYTTLVDDPYELSEDLQVLEWNFRSRISDESFVAAPGSDLWIWHGDLPREVFDKLWRRVEEERAARFDDFPF